MVRRLVGGTVHYSGWQLLPGPGPWALPPVLLQFFELVLEPRFPPHGSSITTHNILNETELFEILKRKETKVKISWHTTE